jgi:hypothetical protein
MNNNHIITKGLKARKHERNMAGDELSGKIKKCALIKYRFSCFRVFLNYFVVEDKL